MKKSKNYIILLLSLVLLPLFSSCFSDSDADNSDSMLDEEELAAYLNKMKGEYKGKLYFTYIGSKGGGAPKMQRDSIENVTMLLNEKGEFVIDRLPVSMYAKAVRAGSSFDFLADEIAKSEDIKVEGKIQPYRSIDGWSYPFYIYPKDNIVLNINKEGRHYKLLMYYSSYAEFMGLQYLMGGDCEIHTNQIIATLPIGGMDVNEVSSGVRSSMYSFAGIRKAPKNK